MSTLFFGVNTLGRVGAVAIHAHVSQGLGLQQAIKVTLDDLEEAHASNLRAFKARYGGRYDNETSTYTRADLRRAVGQAILTVPERPFEPEGNGTRVTRGAWWTGVGGGLAYNCAEDPQDDLRAAKRLDWLMSGAEGEKEVDE
jgi:hypothetical protein